MSTETEPSPWAIALAALRKAQTKKGNPLSREEATEALHSMPATRFSRGTTTDDILETLCGWQYVIVEKINNREILLVK